MFKNLCLLFLIILIVSCTQESPSYLDEINESTIILQNLTTEIEESNKFKLEIKEFVPQESSRTYRVGSDITSLCPTNEEISEILSDFEIYLDRESQPFSCKDSGDESSIELTILNIFRLMRELPLSEELTWAPEYDNIYDWLKDLEVEIVFITNNSQVNSYAGNDFIHLKADKLTENQYRKVIDPSSGTGLINLVVLLVHEARHTTPGGNIGHLCNKNDNNIEEMGAWSVQYILLEKLSKGREEFFSEYEKRTLSSSAKVIYETRFCDYTN